MLKSLKDTFRLIKPFLKTKAYIQLLFLSFSRSFIVYGLGLFSTPMIIYVSIDSLETGNRVKLIALISLWICYFIWCVFGDIRVLVAYNKLSFKNRVGMQNKFMDNIFKIPYTSFVEKFDISKLLITLDDNTQELMQRFTDYSYLIFRIIALIVISIWIAIITNIGVVAMMIVCSLFVILLTYIVNKKIKVINEKIFNITSKLREVEKDLYENNDLYVMWNMNGILHNKIDLYGIDKIKLERKKGILSQAYGVISFSIDFMVYCVLAVMSLNYILDTAFFVTVPFFYEAYKNLVMDIIDRVSTIFNFSYVVDQFDDINKEAVIKDYIYNDTAKVGQINIDNITYTVDGKNILDGIKINITEGQKIFVIGSNGAGKTTLLRAILGVIQPKKGKITIDGIDINNLDYSVKYHKYSYVPNMNMIYPYSVSDNLSFMTHRKIDNSDIIDMLSDLGFADLNDTEFIHSELINAGEELSLGQGQRLSIARGLFGIGQYMILDEPTSHLDRTTRELAWIKIMNSSKTVIATVHDFKDLASRYNPVIIWMDKGRILDQGTYDSLISYNESFKKWCMEGDLI